MPPTNLDAGETKASIDMSNRNPPVDDAFVDRIALALTDRGSEFGCKLQKLILKNNEIGPPGGAALCYLLQVRAYIYFVHGKSRLLLSIYEPAFFPFLCCSSV